MHSAHFSRTGGRFELLQLWVNLPAKSKLTPPRYQALRETDIPVVPLADGAGSVRVIAGEFAGREGRSDLRAKRQSPGEWQRECV
jgi:redox-sensitive bicupin YhaK (pirin superfamily)